MRLAVLQGAARMGAGAVPDNLALVAGAAGRASDARADLLLLPELFPTGYAPGRVAPDPRIVPAVQDIARRHRLAVVATEPADGCIVAVVVGPEGEVLGRYAKTHLFGPDERTAFRAGTGDLLVVEVAGTRVGIAVCYDVEFPELVRGLALAGAELVCVPTAVYDPEIAEILVRARAYENGITVAYANHVGLAYDGNRFCGGSLIVDPRGRVLARAGADEADLLLADLHPEDVALARADVNYLADRRPDAYASLVSSPL